MLNPDIGYMYVVANTATQSIINKCWLLIRKEILVEMFALICLFLPSPPPSINLRFECALKHFYEPLKTVNVYFTNEYIQKQRHCREKNNRTLAYSRGPSDFGCHNIGLWRLHADHQTIRGKPNRGLIRLLDIGVFIEL